MVSSSPFCSTSLSLVVPSSLAVLVYIVSRETPDPFCLGGITCSRLNLSLAFSVVRIVWSFLSSWRLPSWDDYFVISSR